MLLFVFSTLVPPFFSGIVGCASAYTILRITRAHAEKKTGEGDEKTWRQARLDAEKALGSRIEAENRERTLAELAHQRDIATITAILKEVAESQKLLSSLSAESKGTAGRIDGHDRLFEMVNESINTLTKHIHDLAMKLVKP